MAKKKSKAIVKKPDLSVQLREFESELLEVVGQLGLPQKNILVPINERSKVFRNIQSVVDLIGEEQKSRSVYISKFISAVASGLFDAALNYLWDETITELRRRAIYYDVEYLYDNATNEEKRKKIKGPDDITKLDDNELIIGCRKIGLISDLGYKHLDFIRYMRNWASAAHPNQNQITGLQLVSWLETCINEVISLPLSTVAIEIRKLLANIRNNKISESESKKICHFYENLSQEEANNLASGFFGIYIQDDATQQTRENINLLAPDLWDYVDEQTKNDFGIKYGKAVASNDQPRSKLARQFLEIVSGVSYIPEGLKAAEIATAVENLLSAHRGFHNFYSEPMFARELGRLVGQAGKIPKEVNKIYVNGVVEVYLTNGNGIAWNAEPIYISLIKQFNSEQALIAILSITEETINSKLQFPLCADQYIELLNILKPKISSQPVKELVIEIEKYKGPKQNIIKDSRIKSKINDVLKIIRKRNK